jgi:hypothetical protein
MCMNTLFHCVGLEILTAVVTKVTIFWDIGPCSLYMKRLFKVENRRGRNQQASRWLGRMLVAD